MNSDYRVGLGTDLHRLVEGRSLWVGGVEIPSELGADAHSDGDVALHALTDAVLGAAALSDIGELFPDTDAANSGISSSVMLTEAVRRVVAAGWEIVNADVVVELQSPKLRPHRAAMRSAIANALGVTEDQVFLKGKTGEGVGPVGTGAAIAATAVILVRRRGID